MSPDGKPNWWERFVVSLCFYCGWLHHLPPDRYELARKIVKGEL